MLLWVIEALFTNPWISEYLLYQSSIHTRSQANTIHAFEVLACGNPSHNLEVVSTPKPTTITLLLAMSIFSQSRFSVCKRLYPGQCCSLILTCFSRPCSSDIISDVNNRPSVSALGPNCMAATSWLAFSFSLYSRHPGCLYVSCDGNHSLHSPGFVS